jgi:hypothetical protein
MLLEMGTIQLRGCFFLLCFQTIGVPIMLIKKTSNGNATNTNPPDPNVRLIKPSLKQPATAIERLAVAALRQGSTTSLSSLVNRVARELYNEEVARGAGVLDIGLFGPKLFNNAVACELRAANGVLWQFE